MPTLIKAAFLALLWSAPALLWSTTAYHWDATGNCRWQEQKEQDQALEAWQWELMAGDTLRPVFATHACDLICPEFQINWIVVDATCGENNGSAKVEPVGFPAGTSFTYAWSGGVSTTNEADSLAAGIYFVTVSVAVSGNGGYRNCLAETIVPVSNAGGPEVEVSTLPASCLSEAGRVTLNITGGAPPFTINWTGGTRTADALGTVRFVNLAAGTYTFVVTDANGCKTSLIGEVLRDNSGDFDFSLSSTPASGCGATNGTLTVNIQGDFPPYHIALNGASAITVNSTSYTFTGLPAGLYRIRVRGAMLCEEERDISIGDGSPCNISGWIAEDADCSDALGYLIFDGSGAAHETYEVRQKNSTFTFITLTGTAVATIEVSAGEYRIKRISSQDGCICEFGLDVEAPEELTAEVEVIDECTPGGIGSGSIEVVEVTGGTGPYTEVLTDSTGAVIPPPYTNLAPGVYTIKITDANNCQPLTKEIEIEGCPCGPIAVAVTPADTTICEGEPVTLEAIVTSTDPPGAITWFDGAGAQVGTGPSLPLTPAAGANEYTVVVESSCDTATATATARVKVAGNIPLSANPDYLLVCTDDPVTIDVSGPLTECVIWLNDSGVPVDTGAQLTVVPTPGLNRYVATLPGAEACVAPDTVTVEYRTETVTVTTAGVEKVCEGDEVCLLASFTPNDTTVSIAWVDMSGNTLSNDPELCVTPPVGVHQYTVIASNGCSADTATAAVTVIADQTKIEISPDDTVTICAPEEVCFEVAGATLRDCIEWVDASGAVIGSGGELCVTPDQPGLNLYIARTPDSLGLDCVIPDTAYINLITETVMVSVTPDPLKLCVGDTACLTATASPASASDIIRWFDESGAEVGTGSDLCVTHDAPGEYQYIAMADNGCSMDSDTATVIVIADSTKINIQPDTMVVLCRPEEVCLTADVVAAECVVWTSPAGDTLGLGAELCVTPAAGENYYIASIPGLDCVIPDTAVVKLVSDSVSVSVTPDPLKLCVGDTACLTATVMPASMSDLVRWFDESGVEVGTGNELCVTEDTPGEYRYVAMVDNGCSVDSDTATVVVIADSTKIDIQPDTMVVLCRPEEVCLTADVVAAECVVWTSPAGDTLGLGAELCVTPAAGENYYIASIPGLDCVIPDTAVVKLVSDSVSVFVTPDPLKLCVGDTACLTATVTPASMSDLVRWFDESGAEVGTGIELCVTQDTPGEYHYIAVVDNGCSMDSDTATVIVIADSTKIDIQPDTMVVLCRPEEVCLTADVVAAECVVWTSPAGDTLGLGAELCVTPAVGENYYIASIPGLDCVIPDTAVVKLVSDSVSVSVTPDPLKLCVGDTACLTATVMPASMSDLVRWFDESGAEVGTGSELCVTQDTPGSYQYVAMVDNGCSMDSDTATVIVIADSTKINIQPDTMVVLCQPEEVCLTADVVAAECVVWTSPAGDTLGLGAELCVTPAVGENYYIASIPGLDCVIPDTAVVKLISDSVSVSVTPDPLKLCVGDTACLTAAVSPSSMTDLVRWFDASGAEVGTGSELCVTQDTPGEYQYIAMVDNGCSMDSDTATVIVIADSTKINIQPDTMVVLCQPEEVCLTADVVAAECVVWTSPAGDTLGLGAELCVTPAVGENYYIASIPGLDCVIPDTAVVKLISDSVSVSVTPDPLKLCVGDTACLAATVTPASMSGLVRWFDASGAEVGTGSELCVTQDAAGEYRYIAMVDNGCSMGSDTATVIVIADSTKIDIQPDTMVVLCQPEEVCLTADVVAAECVVWTSPAGDTLGLGAELCVTPAVGENYYIASIPGLDCVVPDTAVVKLVPDSISISVTPDPLKLCVGDTGQLTAILTPPDPSAEIVWTIGTDPVPVGFGSVLSVAPNIPGTYVYTATVDNGCTMASATGTVIVIADSTTIDIQPDTTVILCQPEEVCFTADVVAAECVVWTSPSGDTLGLGAELCIIPDPGMNTYIASIPGLDCVISDTARVNVAMDSLMISVNPKPLKLCVGDTSCLTAVVTPSGTMDMVRWFNSSGMQVGTGNTLCVSHDAPGEYQYVATVDNGCSTDSDTATVIVITDSTKIEITPDMEVVCQPEQVCLTADAPAAECVVWTNPAGDTLGMGAQLCIVPNPGVNTYIASIPGLSCVIPDTATVTFIPEDISITVMPDTSKLCVGETAILTAIISPPDPTATIFWTLGTDPVGSGSNISVTPDAPGVYTYTATVENECGTASATGTVIVVAEDSMIEIMPSDTLLCEPDTVCLTANGPVPDCVVWTNLAGDSLGAGAVLCVVPDPGLNYYIATIPGLDCVIGDTATIKLSTPDLSVEAEPSDTIVCRGDSVKLTANVTPDDAMADITWYDENEDAIGTGMMITVSPADTGAYKFIAIADNGCVADTAVAAVTVVDTTRLVITPSDTILCEPDTLKLSVETVGSDYVVWYDENGDSIGTGMMITVVPDYGIHTYSAQIPEAACVEGDTIMVKVLPDTLDLSIAVSDSVACVGDEITFTAQLDPDWTMAQVTWYDEVFVEAGTGDTLTVTAFAGPNIYFAIADNGCVRDTAQAVVEGQELNLSISADPGTICADMGEQSQFSVSGCANCTYQWDNAGTLSDPAIANPVATPNVTTTYTVTVSDGVCVETLSVTVTVEDCPELCPIEEFFVANAFTPNGDNLNDVVCLRSEHFDKFSEIEFMIYNRWGEEVFRENFKADPTDPTKFPAEDFFCWDGTHRGKTLPPDVYGYYLRLVCPETVDQAEEIIEKKGDISLLQR